MPQKAKSKSKPNSDSPDDGAAGAPLPVLSQPPLDVTKASKSGDAIVPDPILNFFLVIFIRINEIIQRIDYTYDRTTWSLWFQHVLQTANSPRLLSAPILLHRVAQSWRGLPGLENEDARIIEDALKSVSDGLGLPEDIIWIGNFGGWT